MRVIEHILGNIRDPQWHERFNGAKTDSLILNQWEAQKSHLRKTTDNGHLIAVDLERGSALADGDVLDWDGETMLVCRICLCDVLCIDLSALRVEQFDTVADCCVRLGHALGNQHWPAVTREGRIFVPLAVSRSVMDTVLSTYNLPYISWQFIPGDSARSHLQPEEVRRLFGGAEPPSHIHQAQSEPQQSGSHGSHARYGTGHAHGGRHAG